MFVMINDGGMLEGRESAQSAEHLLIQRSFMFDLLGQGISLTLLKGTEFRESKVHLCYPRPSELYLTGASLPDSFVRV